LSQTRQTAGAELLASLRERAILHANGGRRIVGRRGEPAAWMLNCWPLTMSHQGLAQVGTVTLDLIDRFEATQIAAYGVGALPLLSACLLLGGGRYSGLTVRSEPKRYGSELRIEGAGDRSRKVVLVDDSISSGTSFRAAADILEQAGYAVEGAACLVNFPFRGGTERARGLGYRIETAFDVWDDLGMPRPTRAPLYLSAMPESWSAEQVPDGLDPASAARIVADHYLRTGETLRPPARFAEPDYAPGGVWVSFRRRSDDYRIARDGFWHFDPADAVTTRDVVLATIKTIRSFRKPPTLDELRQLKIAVTFFSALERISPSELDFERYGIVVRSLHIPAKMGGALPNTQHFTSSFEQYRHARETNARIGSFEPHELFRHELRKRVEPGETWLPYGEDVALTDAWIDAPGLGETLVERATEVIRAEQAGLPVPTTSLAPDLVTAPVSAVAVSLYDRGIIGRSVTFGGSLDVQVVRASRQALRDPRLEGRRRASHGPEAISVSLLHAGERLGALSVEQVARKLRAGRDSFSVHHDGRWALFLDSVIPQQNWSREQAVRALLAMSQISTGTPSWTTYKTASWVGHAGRVWRLESGARRRASNERLSSDDVALLGTHLHRRLDLDGWPASRISARAGTYERSGSAARCLHALQVLCQAGRAYQRPEWERDAQHGLRFAIRHLSGDRTRVLALSHHACGPLADARLLDAMVSVGDGEFLGDEAHDLASRIERWIREDGSVRPEGVTPSRSDADFLPGNALLALVRYLLATRRRTDVNWSVIRAWYERRFSQVHPWALAAWHCQIWPLVSALTGDRSHLEFAFALADWMCGRQLRADGSFLTDLSRSGPSFHTAMAAIGIAAAWHAALEVGESERCTRYRDSWLGAMAFLDRLLIRADDAYWMAEPAVAVGAVRGIPASYELRVDCTSETLLALHEGLRASEVHSRRFGNGD
jgi:orotate phosphoribosyltransferase/AMMECR1 domain-containing protein